MLSSCSSGCFFHRSCSRSRLFRLHRCAPCPRFNIQNIFSLNRTSFLKNNLLLSRITSPYAFWLSAYPTRISSTLRFKRFDRISSEVKAYARQLHIRKLLTSGFGPGRASCPSGRVDVTHRFRRYASVLLLLLSNAPVVLHESSAS